MQLGELHRGNEGKDNYENHVSTPAGCFFNLLPVAMEEVAENKEMEVLHQFDDARGVEPSFVCDPAAHCPWEQSGQEACLTHNHSQKPENDNRGKAVELQPMDDILEHVIDYEHIEEYQREPVSAFHR